jgi:two-component system, NtrC family, C4-dicarboxylate transport sensor histidine kinase DctB
MTVQAAGAISVAFAAGIDRLRRLAAARRRSFSAIALATLLVAAATLSYVVAQRMALQSLRAAAVHRMDLYALNLGNEMRRFEYLPEVVAADPRVKALLEPHPADGLQALVNDYLQTIDESAGASAIYVMDRTGLTVAASNWRQASSFVGMNFSYRPYFQDALKGRDGRFYGVGTVSREPGYYFSATVRDGDRPLGVIAVKVNLEHLDQAWAHSGEKVLVADSNGIVFLSTEPAWKFRALRNLTRETVGRLAATRQYTEAGELEPLALHEVSLGEDGSAVVEVGGDSPARQAWSPSRFVVQSRALPGTDWRMLVMTDVAPVRATARSGAALAVLTLFLAMLGLAHLQQRRKIVAQSDAASAALKNAYEELEAKVDLRTADLSDANRRLHGEISERTRAEESLRATLHDLVHTAKMAVLGRMSASITHELNQPLAAVQTLSDNTVKLLELGRHDEAKENLRMIARTTAHMGQITGQLKKFARRSEIESEPVQIPAVINDAIFLVRQGQRFRSVRLESRLAPGLPLALCEASGLEQVIVNLLANAADAVAEAAEPAIEVVAEQRGGWVAIEVHDNGVGLSDAVRGHLFEPFFTTKEQGVGLGLGLAISNDIVRRFGGTLRAEASARLGGAAFIVGLRAVTLAEAAYA